MEVPADYDNSQAHKPFNIHVRKICYKNPYSSPSKVIKTHLIALAGGPAQTAKVYEDLNFITDIKQIIGGGYYSSLDFCLYITDHRGVGESTKVDFVPEINEAFNNGDIKKIKEADFPFHTLTISNDARDILKLASLIKQEHNSNTDNDVGSSRYYDSGHPFTISLWAVSYGALRAYRAITIDSDMFDAAILQGFSKYERLSIDSDEGFIMDCYRSEKCLQATDDHPENLRNIISHLGEHVKPNKCTQILEEFLKDKNRTLREFYDIKDKAERRRMMILLLYNYKCPDPDKFARLIKYKPPSPHRSYNPYSNRSLSSSPTDTNNVDNRYGGKGNGNEDEEDEESSSDKDIYSNEAISYDEIHVTILINLSEIWNGQVVNFPQFCQYKYMMGLVDDCKYLPSYRYQFEMLKDVLYKTDEYYNEDLKTRKTKIFMIQGEVDLITAVRQAKREFDKIQSPGKTFIISKHSEHESKENTETIKAIMSEITKQRPNNDAIKTSVKNDNLKETVLNQYHMEVKRDRPMSLFDVGHYVPKSYWPSPGGPSIPKSPNKRGKWKKDLKGITHDNIPFSQDNWEDYVFVSNAPSESEMKEIMNLRKQKKESMTNPLSNAKKIKTQTESVLKSDEIIMKPLKSSSSLPLKNKKETIAARRPPQKKLLQSFAKKTIVKPKRQSPQSQPSSLPGDNVKSTNGKMTDYINLLEWLFTI